MAKPAPAPIAPSVATAGAPTLRQALRPAQDTAQGERVPMAETAITLLKPHTHAGHDYAPGAQLTLAADSAAWLIRIGTARLT
mgnify:CR=1 FL=1